MKNKNLVQVSDSIIYIMSDGVNSKIGITSNLQNRVSTYKTHNPTATLFSHYICPKAKDIESAIKNLFKDKTITSSKEWFNLNPNYLDRIVSLLVNGDNNTHLDIIPAKSKIEVPLEYLRCQNLNMKNVHNLSHGWGDEFQRWQVENQRYREERRDNLEENQRFIEDGRFCEEGQNILKKMLDLMESIPHSMLEIISKYFNLGVPEHKLPKTIFIEPLGIDPYESNLDADIRDISSTHNYKFYSLVDTEDKKQVAICNAIICVVKKEETVRYQQISYDCGFFCLEHQEWLPYLSSDLTLLVIMWKTPLSVKLSLWQNSFKKWVIENQSYISSMEPEFLSLCQKNEIQPPRYSGWDTSGTFRFFLEHIERLPLHLNESKDMGKYLSPYTAAMSIRVAFLFAKWKGEEWVPSKDEITMYIVSSSRRLNLIEYISEVNSKLDFVRERDVFSE